MNCEKCGESIVDQKVDFRVENKSVCFKCFKKAPAAAQTSAESKCARLGCDKRGLYIINGTDGLFCADHYREVAARTPIQPLKPSLGVMPRRLWLENRAKELARAIRERAAQVEADPFTADAEPIEEWAQELYDMNLNPKYDKSELDHVDDITL